MFLLALQWSAMQRPVPRLTSHSRPFRRMIVSLWLSHLTGRTVIYGLSQCTETTMQLSRQVLQSWNPHGNHTMLLQMVIQMPVMLCSLRSLQLNSTPYGRALFTTLRHQRPPSVDLPSRRLTQAHHRLRTGAQRPLLGDRSQAEPMETATRTERVAPRNAGHVPKHHQRPNQSSHVQSPSSTETRSVTCKVHAAG